ncbi:unnamed protein product [Closterium sp. NIES-54]
MADRSSGASQMAVDSRLITSHGATEHSAEPALLPTTSTFFSSNKSADSSSSPSSSYSSHGSTAKAYQEVPIYHATDAAPLPEAPSPSFSPFRTAPYSDRFIPSRSSSLAFSFPLLDRPGDPPQTSHGFGAGPEGREDSAAAYSLLLKSQLLGGQLSASPALGSSSAQESDCVLGRPCRVPLLSAATSPYSSSPSPLAPKNLFRYINGASSAGGAADHGGGSGLDSPLSLSPIGLDAALCGLPFSPKKAPRKIARSPFKVRSLAPYRSLVIGLSSHHVLDPPVLEDDFYPNLVDWSSTNVLAVGRGSFSFPLSFSPPSFSHPSPGVGRARATGRFLSELGRLCSPRHSPPRALTALLLSFSPPHFVPHHQVLDALALLDDFYLNLVDWSSTTVLAVGLNSCSSSPSHSPSLFPTHHQVLDAPALQDDFYLNLVDWSSTNVLAVGLGSCVYLWSAASSKVI